jgi:DNA-directed RNA polymerase specialized sigma24 family protein
VRRDAFYPWIYRVIIREATRTAKGLKHSAQVAAVEVPSHATSAAERLDLRAAIAALPMAQRTAIVFYYYAGFQATW